MSVANHRPCQWPITGQASGQSQAMSVANHRPGQWPITGQVISPSQARSVAIQKAVCLSIGSDIFHYGAGQCRRRGGEASHKFPTTFACCFPSLCFRYPVHKCLHVKNVDMYVNLLYVYLHVNLAHVTDILASLSNLSAWLSVCLTVGPL